MNPWSAKKTHIAMRNQEEIQHAVAVLYERLETLRSIPSANVFKPAGPQTHYHRLIEEASATYHLLVSELAALYEQVDFEQQRLDAARQEQLEKLTQEEEMSVELQPVEEARASDEYEEEGQ
jgi:hypothetical protein